MFGDGRSVDLLLLGGLSPNSFPPFSVGVRAGPPFRDTAALSESDATALALALSFSFSLSVWLTGLGLGIPRLPVLFNPIPGVCSLSLEFWGTVVEGLISPELVSMVLLTGRAELGRVRVRVLVLAGRGKERYWRDVLAFGDKNPVWSLLETSRLVLRPPPPAPGLTGMPDILIPFPTFVELLGMQLPPVLITGATLGLLVLLQVAVVGFL